MSTPIVEAILSRIISDARFAQAFFADPEKALAGYDLTKEEIGRFANFSRADFERYVNASPEERRSFAIASNHNERALRAE
ncbi:MAG: hypothetical protein HY867_13915 [Chloroflexi bacterium]|nr:hypothetical protein [Chloroflexota bacterium]